MRVLSVMNQKGGCGKSVITAILANTLSVDFGLRVMVVEVDEQQSLLDSRKEDMEYEDDFPYEIKAMPIVIQENGKPRRILAEFIERQDELDELDLILVDIPGRTDDTNILSALGILDGFLIPLVADRYDKNASYNFCVLAKQIELRSKQHGRDIDIWGVRNKLRGRYEEQDFVEFCGAIDLNLFESSLRDLVAYSRVDTYSGYINNSTYKEDIRKEVKNLATEFIDKFKIAIHA